jgi:spore maturation protein CgeB
MNVVFFKSKTFCAQEVENALKKRRGINLLISSIPPQISPQAAQSVFDQLKSHVPAIIISINNAGYDLQGALSDLIVSSGSYQCNWFTDDPFYEDIFYNRRLPNFKNRLDFVSEESFITPMKEKGYSAHFLPLAVDPLYFNTYALKEYARDCAFVGNSSEIFLDSLITKEAEGALQRHTALLSKLKAMYQDNPRDVDIKKYLRENPSLWPNIAMEKERFLFCMEWLVGYFYRRDFIVEMANSLKGRFLCFGDPYWSKYLDKAQVSTDARYYANLCSYYRSTKVNLNINRIQIKTSFTQRIFDCKAGGAFVLTERRPLNKSFFVTEGDKKELVEFSSWQECLKLIDYYCEHDEEREAIAMAGRDKVLAEHTYDNRIEQIFETCGKEWGI